MEWTSKTVALIADLENQIRELRRNLIGERERFVAEKIAAGWTRFNYKSQYYGSHPEYGEGEVEMVYLFSPGIDASRWVGVDFAHGHHGCHDENNEFASWLEAIGENQYFVLD